VILLSSFKVIFHSFKLIFIMEQKLIARFHRLRDSLLANDPSLTRLEPWQGMDAIPFSFHYLEDYDVQQALADCFAACLGNQTVTSVVLQALPEPELCQALHHISSLVNLRELRIVNNTKSQSLNLTVLTTFLQAHHSTLIAHRATSKKTKTRSSKVTNIGPFGLQRIYSTTRLQIMSQAHIADFATCLGTQANCSTLQSLSLKLIPRCSIQEPNLTLDPILQACAALPVLQTVRLSAGYDHNPYDRPLVSAAVLRALLWTRSNTNSSLQRLCLENVGLESHHVETVACQLKENTALIRLDLPRNPHIGATAWEAVAKVLQERSNCTLQTCLFDTGASCHDGPLTSSLAACTVPPMEMDTNLQRPSSPLGTVHQKIQLATYLNRLGIHELLQKSCHHDWINCMTQANHPTAGAAAEQQTRPQTSRLRRFHDVDYGDDAQALLSLNASYTLLRLNPSLCASSSSTPPVAATHSHHLRRRTKASIVPPELLSRRDWAVLVNTYENAADKTDATVQASAVSALSASVKTAPTQRGRMPQSLATAGNVADGSSSLFWPFLI
jgi:hypothetical protein